MVNYTHIRIAFMKLFHSISHVQQLILGVSSQSTHIYCTGRASALSIITSLAFFQPDIQTTIHCMEKVRGDGNCLVQKRSQCWLELRWLVSENFSCNPRIWTTKHFVIWICAECNSFQHCQTAEKTSIDNFCDGNTVRTQNQTKGKWQVTTKDMKEYQHKGKKRTVCRKTLG